MIILLIGAPGSGKGTQAKMISKEFQFVHMSSGHLLRQLASESNGKLSEILNKGHLVPDEVVNKFILDKLKETLTLHKNILLDGFPRNITQNDILQNHYS